MASTEPGIFNDEILFPAKDDEPILVTESGNANAKIELLENELLSKVFIVGDIISLDDIFFCEKLPDVIPTTVLPPIFVGRAHTLSLYDDGAEDLNPLIFTVPSEFADVEYKLSSI